MNFLFICTSAFQEATIQNQLQILEEFRDLKRLILRNQPAAGAAVPELARVVEWPLKSEDEFNRCEEILATESNFAKEVS